MEQQRLPDFISLYNAWDRLPPGSQAELRRAGRPEYLLEVPAFYRLFSGRASSEWEKQAYQRLIFCLPYIRYTERRIGLGEALAAGKGIGEKRLFQVVRSEPPNDMLQLRRILQMAKPTVYWPAAARLLWYWNERSKRDLLEDYFMHKKKEK